MARIRTIKPEFWQSESMAALPFETRLLAIALLNYADDYGYFKAHPNLVKASCFPLDDSLNIPGMLDELSRGGYLALGKMDGGVSVGKIVKFLDHQRIDKPSKSKFHDESITWLEIQESSPNAQGGLFDGSRLERKGKEGNKEQGIHLVGKPTPAEDQEFEAAWKKFPKRSGNNPKADALKCWHARRKEGVPAQAMADGVDRYASWCESTDKIGTETVMQAARFFGKSRPFEQEFSAPRKTNGASAGGWKLDDNLIMAKATELKISINGLIRAQAITKIERAMDRLTK